MKYTLVCPKLLTIYLVFSFLFLNGCGSVKLNINRIDQAEARQKLLDSYVNNRTNNSSSDRAIKLIRKGVYEYVGAKSTSGNNSVLFLYECSDRGKSRLLGCTGYQVISFSVSDNASIRMSRSLGAYKIKGQGIKICEGQATTPPKVTSHGVEREISRPGCPPCNRFELFDSKEGANEFASTLISAFPWIEYE